MSSVMSLPSTSVVYETLKGFVNPDAGDIEIEETKSKWKQLCLAALSYGTDYSVPTLRVHTNDFAVSRGAFNSSTVTTATSESQQHQQPKLKLKIRASKTLALFIDVLATFDANLAASNNLRKQVPSGKKYEKQLYLQQIDPARLILVDSLWIVGQLLVPPDVTSNTPSSTADPSNDIKSSRANEAAGQNMEISHANNQISNRGNQVDQRPSLMTAEEEEELREESMVAYTCIVQGLAGMKMDANASTAIGPTKASVSTIPTVPPHLMQMLLDPYQLSKAAIVPHEQFIRKYRKYQTNILYRQRRFNLLVEESEGWAKILTLLSSLPLMDNDSGAACVLEQLRGYIGAFDLDPNRLLSMLLDVLELELDRTVDEILKETHCVGRREKNTPVGNKTLIMLLELIIQFKVSALPHLLGFKLQHLTELAAPTEKPTEGGETVEKLHTVPLSFFNLCAFLVSQNAVSLKELYPYFAPQDDNMRANGDAISNVPKQSVSSAQPVPVILGEWTKARQKEIAQDVRNWGQVSLNAANTGTTEVQTTNATTELVSLHVDKEYPALMLLESLLTFGAWNFFVVLLELCRFPPPSPLFFPSTPSQQQQKPVTSSIGKSCDIDVILLRPTIGKTLCELLHLLLDPWHRNSNMNSPCLWISKSEVSDMPCDLGELAGIKALKIDHYKGYLVKRFSQLIPVEATIENASGAKGEESRLVDNLFEPILVLASSQESVPDAALYLKLCRLFKSFLEKDLENLQGDGLSPRGKIIFQKYLLPAQSLYPANPQLSLALWSCLKLLPYTTRYSLYDAWAHGPRNLRRSIGASFALERNAISKTALLGRGCLNSDKTLWAVQTEVVAGKETRSVLKRLAKETIGEQSRRFAKVSGTSPIVAFSILIQQMQAYDNMIDLMVDSFRLCSDLSRDVLVWCLLQNLAGVGKLDIASTQLLSSIETFTGTFYRTFPHLEIDGIFDWLLSILVAPGPVTSMSLAGLGVIRSLLTTAGGLEVVGGEGGAVSGQQLEGRAGSQLLRRETVSFGIVDRVNPVASTALLSILLSSDSSGKSNNIGIALLIRLAQLRLKVLFDPDLKIEDVMQLGKICDSIQTTMLLLLEFLSTPRDWKESEAEEFIINYSSNIPPLHLLLDRKAGYGIDAAAVFAIVRPCIRAALMAEEQLLEKREQEEAELLERGESRHTNGTTAEDDIGVPAPLKRWLPSSPAIHDVCCTLIPCSFQKAISSTLYCTFWSLDLFDLYVPKHRYTSEINRLSKEEERLLLLKQRRIPASETHPFAPKDAAELKRVSKNATKLKDDLLKQSDHSKFVKSKKFEADIDKFFLLPSHDEINVDTSMDADHNRSESSTKAFLTICIFPRALSSPDGAFYCAQFVQRLHNMNTPRFSTLQFFDYLVKASVGALMYLTEEEAQNLGILLEALWGVIAEWRYGNSDEREAEKAYQREVMTKQGSILEMSSDPVTYVKYKSIYARWHDTLGKAFLGCLEAKSKGADVRLTNLRVRSAINILTRLVRIYPTRPEVGDALFKRLKTLQEDESRQETKAMANAYVAQLTKAMLEGCWKEQTATDKREWVEQQQARAEERKKRAEQTQKEMAAENARIDKITEGRDSRGRGDNSRFGREWDKTSDRRKIEEKVVQLSQRSPELMPFNAPVDTKDRERLSDKDRDWDREREYRERERVGERGRNMEALNDSDRRVPGARSGRSAPSWQASSTQASATSSKGISSGLEGRWHGTLSSAPPPGKNDREGSSKRGRSPSESAAPPEKKARSEDDRGRAQGQSRQGRFENVGKGDPGWRH